MPPEQIDAAMREWKLLYIMVGGLGSTTLLAMFASELFAGMGSTAFTQRLAVLPAAGAVASVVAMFYFGLKV
ncbi:hypothetical protein [Rhizobium sp. BK176]|uniref:hypothetical protein n=1 Tax=Rhizobium sp. BK176 TaxID=2587071 RepID=UPI00216787BB|nr:hypothetical protein [Rhizobium sp. BK176]MCS4089019.1 hypothetical protein [Rhizobium sp. BK176]